jgi:mannan endo-1,4-beta-mannosidase
VAARVTTTAVRLALVAALALTVLAGSRPVDASGAVPTERVPAAPAIAAPASGDPAAPLAVEDGVLVADGRPVWLTGINAPQAASLPEIGPGCGAAVEPADVFATVPPGGLVRVWFTRSMAPVTVGGARDWQAFDRVVEAAAASPRHPRLIVTLATQSGACDDATWKDSAFYREGWRGDYAAFVAAVVDRYAAAPAVAMWEPVNEPEAADCSDVALADGCYATKTCPRGADLALRAFFDGVGADIHRRDPGSLVATGALGGAQCGWAEMPSAANASAEVDVLTFHDYGREADAVPAELAGRLDEAAALGKPLIVEELGVLGRDGQDCRSTRARAEILSTKVVAAHAAGAAAVVLWSFGGAGPAACDTYLLDGDPAYALLAKASALVPPERVALGPDPGWWAVSATGAVTAHGSAPDLGDARAVLAAAHERTGDPRAAEAVDLAPTPTGEGYWILDAAGAVHPRGDAVGRGGFPRGALDDGERAVALAVSPSGDGYWIVTDHARVRSFGDARPLGSRSPTVGAPVVDAVATRSGAGVWLLTADGSVVGVGPTRPVGSPAPDPVAPGTASPAAATATATAIVADSDGTGYWVLDRSGGVQAVDAVDRGDLRSAALDVDAAALLPHRRGYLVVTAAGMVYDLSGSHRSGPAAGTRAGAAVAVVGAPR